MYLNTWLRREGYLEVEGGGGASGFLSNIGLTQQNLVDLLSRFGLLNPLKDLFGFLGFNPGKSLPEPGLSDIDFNRTLAYAGNYGGKIYLTENAEDRRELLEELERKLENLEDSETGRRIFEEVYRPEEIYTGDMEDAPDLILKPGGPYRAVGFLGHQQVVGEPPKKSGTHRMDGIYVISRGSGEEDANITDVAPTVLDVLDVEIPDEMDGESILN